MTDEVVTKKEEQPCLDHNLINDFNSYNPIFGAILIDQHKSDTLLPLFLDSLHCLITNYSNNYSVIQTNSTMNPLSTFTSFYGFIDDLDADNLNFNSNSCDTMVNSTWPGIDFDYFVPFNGMLFVNIYINSLCTYHIFFSSIQSVLGQRWKWYLLSI